MKTISLKKVSAVAVASLGFGLLSVVPAQAVITLPLWIDTATTVGGVAITADTATVTRTLNTQVNAAAVKTITAPAGAAIIFTVKTGGTFVTTNIIDMYIDGTIVQSGTTLGTAATAVTVTRNLPSPTTTTTYNYLLKVYETAGTDRAASTLTADLPVAITVVPASGYSNALSTAHSITGDGGVAAVAADDLVPLLATKTLATTTRAAITVTLRNAANATMTTGNTLTAVMSGVGGLGSTTVTADTPGATDCSATVIARVKTLAADAVNTFTLCSDGNAGKGTVTISVTNAAGVTQVLATKDITFFGAAASLSVSAQPIKVLAAGGGTSGVITGITGTALATQPAFVVKVSDSGGNAVSGLTASLTGSSADVTQVSAVANNEGVVANDATAIYGGDGFYVFNATAPGSAKSSATPTVVTISMTDPADSTKKLTTTVSFTVGGTASTVVATVDKTVYAAGDKATLTLTAKDASGNPVADGAANLLGSTGLTASKGVQGSLPTAASVETKSGVKTYTFFAPVSGGSFSINGTVGTAAVTASVGSAITVSSSVTDANAALLTQVDALNAKIVALNALIAKIMKKLGVK